MRNNSKKNTKKITDKLSALKKSVQLFPNRAGVYLMKRGEEPLYVGKAKSLKSRALSYFNKAGSLKTEFLLKKTERIEYLVTENEVEAFLLEASLIKKHKPKYNVRLKDDKSYPYIRFAKNALFPRFYFDRRVRNSKDIYFGPYTEALNVRKILDFLNKSFLLRDCSDSDFNSRKRPCLNFDMGICSAPCVQKITQEDYAKACRKALSFLKGNSRGLVQRLQTELKQAVKELKFELAGKIRDQLLAVEMIEAGQEAVQKTTKDKDVAVLKSLAGKHLIEILHFRQGRLIGNRSQLIKRPDPDFLLSFLNQYYSENLIPDELIINLKLNKPDCRILEKVLTKKKKSPCFVLSDLNAENTVLLRRAEANADSHLKNEIQKTDQTTEHLKEIQRKFRLPSPPYRIECYDISHWQGSYSVGSGVVFEGGEPFKKDYRRYNLKSVAGGDDYLALQEVLSRRLKHKEWERPDLILIDGGRGQLKAVQSILESFDKKDWPLASLAKDRVKESSVKALVKENSAKAKALKQSLSEKKMIQKTDVKIKHKKRADVHSADVHSADVYSADVYSADIHSIGERFFLPGRKNPVIFPPHSKALKILLNLRDEAHRFAVQSHRKKREKSFLSSSLDSIKGLGDKTKEKLLKECGSLKNIKAMSEKELAALSFISPSLAKKIKAAF